MSVNLLRICFSSYDSPTFLQTLVHIPPPFFTWTLFTLVELVLLILTDVEQQFGMRCFPVRTWSMHLLNGSNVHIGCV